MNFPPLISKRQMRLPRKAMDLHARDAINNQIIQSTTHDRFVNRAIAIIAGTLFLHTGPVSAATIDLGPTLPVLNKIQGAWKSGCHPVEPFAQRGYRIDFLNINFTQLQFNAHIYTDEACRNEVSRWPAVYRYTLGAPLQLKSGEQVFELNLQEESDSAEAWQLAPANILFLEAGQLWLGHSKRQDASQPQRVNSLDRENPFKRP